MEPGATIPVMSLMGSSRFDEPDEHPAGYQMIGDSASIPALNGIIGVIPEDVRIEVYLEKHDDHDTLIPLAQHPRLRVRWVPRDGEKSLAAAIEGRDWSRWYAWATPEATALKHVRAPLRHDFAFPKSGYMRGPTGGSAERWETSRGADACRMPYSICVGRSRPGTGGVC